jgi:hypothetical protein
VAHDLDLVESMMTPDDTGLVTSLDEYPDLSAFPAPG